jgi:hypothetical protein
VVLADFTISVEFEELPREVRVIVYDNVKGLRIAATRYENRTTRRSRRRRGLFSDTLGICHRFEWLDDQGRSKPECALVRLAKPYIGVGIVSHELSHAAVWMRQLNGDVGPLTIDNDEPLVWLIGELVRQAINALNERGVYDE